jgi:hypothetical protein
MTDKPVSPVQGACFAEEHPVRSEPSRAAVRPVFVVRVREALFQVAYKLRNVPTAAKRVEGGHDRVANRVGPLV